MGPTSHHGGASARQPGAPRQRPFSPGASARALVVGLVSGSLMAGLPSLPARAQASLAARSQQSRAQAVASEPPLGVWLTTVDSRVLFDPLERSRAVTFLVNHGFRRAALPIYSGGWIYGQLDPDHNRLGLRPDPQLNESDAVGATVEALHAGNLEAVGWLEFGLMAPRDAAWLRGREALLLQDRHGSTLWSESPSLQRVWLNPSQPEVRQFLVDLVVDSCRRYRFEALQFDDHLGYPVAFGYDPATLALWRGTPAGARRPLPDENDPDWIRWRADRVTALLMAIREAMRQACPDVRLSIAPNPQDFSLNNYLADWSDWVERGLVDEVVVQLYRNSAEAVARELASPSLVKAAARVPLRIGLLAGLRQQPKQPATLRQEMALLKQAGVAGIDLFFYESARQHFPLAAPGLGLSASPDPARPAPHPQSPPPAPDR